MAQKESQTGPTISAELGAVGKKRVDQFVKFQSELLDKLSKTNQQWLDRAQLEANLASEFASKLTAARSIPEVAAVCQEWTTRRFELLAEDGKRVLADAQKFMEAGARLLSSDWPSKGGGTST